MPGERKRSSTADKKSKDDDDDVIPIVVNISPTKTTRGSPSVKLLPNGSSASSPAANCVPQRKAAASAEKSFSANSQKTDEKKKGKKESSDGNDSDEEKKTGKKKTDEKNKKKGKKDSSDDDEPGDEKKAKEGKKNSKDSSDEDEDEEDEDEDSDSTDSDSDSKSPAKKGSTKPKSTKVMMDPKTNEAVDSVNCTACGKQTPAIKHKIKRHPTLNCLVCRRCHQFYFDGEFERDEDGTEQHCQWCAEGGNVLMCDDCPHVFCRSCLKRNLGRDGMNEIEKADNWKCLVCDPKPAEPLIRECNRVMTKIGESQQEKVNLKLDKVATAIADLDKGVQLWSKYLKNVRGDFKDLEKKKKKKSADEYQKKMTKVGKDVAKVVKSIKTIVTKVEGDLTVSSKSTTNGDDSEIITIEEIVDDDTPVDTSLPKNSSKSHTSNANASKANANAVSVDLSDISSASGSDDDSDSSSESDDNRRKSGYEADPSFSKRIRGKKGKDKAEEEDDEDEEGDEEENEDKGKKEKKEKRAPPVKKKRGREKTKAEPTAMKMKRKKPGEKAEEEGEEEEKDDESVEENEKAKRDLLKMMKESSDSDADDEDDEEEEGGKKKKKSEMKKKEDKDETMEVDSEDEGHDSELEEMMKKWGKKVGKTKWLAGKKKTEKKDGEKDVEKDVEKNVEKNLEKDVEKDVKKDVKKDVEKDVEKNLEKDVEKDVEKEKEGEQEKVSDGKKKSKAGKSLSGVDLFAEGDTDYEDDGGGGDADDDGKTTLKEGAKESKDNKTEKLTTEDGAEEEKENSPMDANEAAKNDLKAMMEESDDDDDDDEDDGKEDDEFIIEGKNKKKDGKEKDGNKKNQNKNAEGKSYKKSKETKEEEVIVEDDDEEEGKPKTQTGKYRKGLLNAKITISSDEEGDKKRKKPDKSKEEGKDEKGKKEDKGKKGKTSKEDSDREEVLIESMDEEEEEEEEKTAAAGKKDGKAKEKEKKKDEKKKTESDSDSDFISGPKKRNQRKRRRDDDSDVVDLSDGDDAKKKESKKKRKRVKKGGDSSCEEDKISGAEDNDDESPRKRKRKIIKDSKLEETTKAALEEEEARRKRVKEKQKLYNDVRTEDDPSSPVKCPKVTSLVLDRDDKKEPIIQVEASICENLKPHQVEGIRFMYDCVVESVERVQKGDGGGGSILAHCMGLGKTLQVIALVHTILTHEKLLKFRKVLIICPVNVCLNWVDEFIKWVPEDSLDIYEMSSIKDNRQRAQYLEEWQEEGGVMILGYDMFRNLASGSHCRQKKLRETFEKCLINPGADLIVCDEGHLLKNEATAISKVISTVKTRRRISLTGTPLQNNLIEYHCMVQFVKPNLLGTKKEFLNRFVNPILAGQGKDSSAFDVKLMKQRAHILHEMLDGCVQRRDYTALTKFLPPKHEYVIKVRLSPLQIKLYQEYLDQFVHKKDQPPEEKSKKLGAGGRLFQDYQYLSRIWTHPQCLAIAQRRADIRDQYKWIEESDADSDLMTSSSDEDTPSSDDSDIICEDGEKNKNKKKKKKRKKSGKKSEDEGDAVEDEEKKKKKEAKKEKKAKKKQELEEDDKLIGNGKADSPKKGGKANREDSPEYTRTGRRKRACTKKDGEDSPRRSPTPPKEEEYWWTPLVKEACPEEGDLAKPVFSGKMSMLINILRESESVGDKVLVFSQSLSSLDMIEEYLAYENGLAKEGKLTEHTASAIWGWNRDDDYFRMDGGTNCDSRQRQMALFNDTENSQARLFLISTRAGSLGTNMVGANRVVVFDASWNPSYDVQSIFRVYRYGQNKPVYIYRLIAQATMEEKIYDRQVNKQSLAHRVIDEHQIDRHFNAGELQELYRFEPDRLDDPNRKEPPTPVLPKDRLLADMLKNMADRIYHYHEHDSLLENKVEDQLTEDERKAAWEEFEREKSTGYRQQPNPQFASYATGAAGMAGAAPGAPGGQPVPINFNGPINQYLMYISQMERSQRMQAEMALMKMIYSANPHLTAGQEGMVYQRMQGIIARYEQTQRQQQHREMQRQQRMRLQQEQEARINAALYNQLGAKTTRLHSPYAQQAYAAQAAQAAFSAARQASTSSGARKPFPTSAPQPAAQMSTWEALKSAIIKQIDAKDHSLQMLIPFVYANYPPKDKRRFGDEEMAKFKSLVQDKRPEAKKKVKHLLLKVIQDYHPDKVADHHGEQWKLVSEEISKRLNKYFGELK